MTKSLRWIIGTTAIAAPSLHLLSDLLEWLSGGFFPVQLLINYPAFMFMPFLMLGLYAIQQPRMGWVGLIGTVLYSIAFIYFAHTTLVALEHSISDYEMLLQQLGGVYTFHGGVMIIGGTMFGIDSLKAKVFSSRVIALFLIGISLNLAVALLPLPDILQILGSLLRNVGLIAMGITVIRKPL